MMNPRPLRPEAVQGSYRFALQLEKQKAPETAGAKDMRLPSPREASQSDEKKGREQKAAPSPGNLPHCISEEAVGLQNKVQAVKRIGTRGICEPSLDVSDQEEPGMDSQAVESWAETFLRSRVLTEILMTHFEVRVKNTSEESEEKPTHVGIFDLKCDPWQICQAAIAEIESGHRCQIEAENSSGGIEFCHVPRYLFYIMEELLSNSARAAAEREEGSRTPGAPIKVSLCADESQVVIRISDRAGGIPSSCANKVWSYVYTTAADTPRGERRRSLPGPWAVCEDSPVAGRGIGLPLCRLYALYLGGSLHLMNLPGLGVDAYLFLNRIDPQDALDSLQC